MSIIHDKKVQAELEEIFVSAFGMGSFDGTDGKDIKFLFSWPPEILNDEDYQNPWSSSNPKGLMSSVENISTLVDPIPAWNKSFLPSGSRIEEVYQIYILSARTASAESSASKKLLREAPIKSLGQASNGISTDSPGQPIIKQMNFGAANTDIIDAIEPIGTMTDEDRENERALSLEIANRIVENKTGKIQAINISDLQQKLSGIQLNIKNFDINLETTEIASSASIVKSMPCSSSVVDSVISMANQLFSNTRKASLNNPSIIYHPSSIIPSNFASDEDAGDWASMNTEVKDENSNDVKISLKYTRADIVRPWLVNSILNLYGWKVDGINSGFLSNGDTQSNNGIFPFYPLSLILCRDLEITGQGGDSFSAKGLQIICRCCKVNPKLPPCD